MGVDGHEATRTDARRLSNHLHGRLRDEHRLHMPFNLAENLYSCWEAEHGRLVVHLGVQQRTPKLDEIESAQWTRC